MSKRANPTTVGLFIITGLVLAVGGIILFGSLRWFSPVMHFVVYFDDSAQGLDVGAPVKLRGVRIGQVKEVMIHFNQATNDLALPVLIEIDGKALQAKTDFTLDVRDRALLDRSITNNGLRARLELESFVTGRLFVDLSLSTNAPPPAFHQIEPLFYEIPSQPADLTRLKRTLSNLDIEGIANDIKSLLVKLNEKVDQLQIQELSGTAISALQRLDRLAGSPQLTNAIASLTSTMDRFGQLAARLEGHVDPLAHNAEQTLAQASQTLGEAGRAVEQLQSLLNQRSPLRTELNAVLLNLAEAADSVSALAEFLRRNPQALLSGRQRSSDSK